MQPNEFDELIRSKFDQEEFAYKPELWQQLSQQLPVAKEKKSRIGIFWWQVSGIAAAVALIVVSVINWQQPAKEESIATAKKNESIISQQSSAPAAAVIAAKESTEEKEQEPFASGTFKRNNNKNGAFIAKSKDHGHAKAATQSIVPPVQKEQEIIADVPRSGFSDKTDETPAEPMVAEKKKQPRTMDTYDPLMLPEREKTSHKTSFSFTGGVNYGSLNTGYTVAVTAQRNISRKIYLEGNVGLVNGNAETISTYSAFTSVPVPKNAEQPGIYDIQGVKNSIAETSITTTTPLNLYYFQVAPVIGYNVYKGLSVGVGADFQRLLFNESQVVKNDAGTLQRISMVDVGISGKTEYQISRKVKAGILYRNGVNNLLPQNKKYLDRDYLQVQFKYTFTR